MARICYFCGKPAPSVEHVPPQSFFPIERRLNLLTVPSCELHNTAKSHDDEYLRALFTSAISGNDIARKEVWPKVIESLKQEPGKHGFFKNLRSAKVGDISTGIFDPDINRFRRVVGTIGRALYFAMFESVWSGEVHVIPPSSAFYELNNGEGNAARQTMELGFDKWLGGIPRFGQNPDVFSLQYFGDEESGIMRQIYFGGINVLVVFGEHELGLLFLRLAQKIGMSNPNTEDPQTAVRIQSAILKMFPISRRVTVHSQLN